MNNPLHILLIDDNPDDRTLVIRELRREFSNLQVEQIPDAKGFAQVLERGDFDLVVTDYQLCWSDGLAVLRAVKARWPDCPVIMFTGTGSEEIAVEAMKAGLDDYVLKSPKHFIRLPAAVLSALEKAQQDQARKEAEARYRSLFERVPIGLYRISPAGQILDANPALVQMLGYPDRESLLAVNATDLYVDPEERRRWQALMEREGVVRDFEVSIRRRDGTIIWVENDARAFRDASGRVLYYEGSLEDITERKRAEEEKEKIQAQLLQVQKMEAVGTLAGGVAHDFNNLLTTIHGYTELAMMELNEGDPLYRDLREVQRASVRAANLTRQLLLFSRRQPIEMSPLNLNKTIKEMMEMVRRLIGEDIAVTTSIEEELWMIKADPGNIEQVIMNLIVNARDAMPEGGEITIGTKNVHLDEDDCKAIVDARPGNFACLSIADTGIGMDKKTVEHIFEPFFSTKGPGKGTGLGLSVAYGIIKQHEGWINVYSEPGRGTTFRIYLPAVPVKLDTVDEGLVSPAEFKGRGEQILLVEDDQAIRELIARILQENGYVVFAAANAEEALGLFEQKKGEFHLIFSDVILPDQTGLQLVAQLLSGNPELRVLLSSGYTDQKSQWPVIRERGFRFLQKPYSLPDLLRAIRETIEQDK